MAEKEQLQLYLAGMHKHLTSLDELCEAAKHSLRHSETALSEASASATAHGEALSDVERQRYAGLVREAQENLNIAVRAREEFHAKLQQLEDRIARS
jgi:uncharacterized membrane protein